MKSLLIFGGILLIGAGLLLGQNAGGSAQSPRAVLDQYCVTCHNEKTKTAGLMLDKMDPARVAQNAEAWEKVVRKLRAGMMPPQGLPRPSAPAYEALTVALEDELDRAAAAKPKLAAPGVTRFASSPASISILRHICPPTIPATDSTTSRVDCKYRRRWWKDMFRRRRN